MYGVAHSRDYVQCCWQYSLCTVLLTVPLAVYVLTWKITYSKQAKVRFACCITEGTHWDYVMLIVFPRQQWLRERKALLRCTYSASYVPCYVRLLCTCTVCSVYRVPSVIMCCSTLILPSIAVTAVCFEMRYYFSTRALRVDCQYSCTTRYSNTAAWERVLWKNCTLF